MLNELEGGVKERLTYEDIKYTLNAERVSWVNAVYPVLNQVIDVASSVDVGSWRYSGPIGVHVFAGDGETSSETVTDLQYLDGDLRTPARATVFGGCVYELLNDQFPDARLHKFTDPTGDVDVMVTLPTIVPSRELKQLIVNADSRAGVVAVPVFPRPLELNPVYASYMRFMHSALVQRLQEMPDLLNSPFFDPFPASEYSCEGVRETYADMTVEDQRMRGFYETQLGKVLVVTFAYVYRTTDFSKMSIDNSLGIPAADAPAPMLKTQMVVKAGGVVDHVLEFVTSAKMLSQDRWLSMPYTFSNGRSGYVQNMESLMFDNMEALQKRGKFMDILNPSQFHKGVNHVNRLLYLLEFMHCYKGVVVHVSDVERALFTFLLYFVRSFKQFQYVLPFFKRQGTFLQRVDMSLKFVLEAYEDVIQYGGGGAGYYTNLTKVLKSVSLPSFTVDYHLKGMVLPGAFVSPTNQEAHDTLMTLVLSSVEQVRLLKVTRDKAATLAALTAALKRYRKL